MIVWTDIESTGLDERTDLLLEVALLATTDELIPIDGGVNVVISHDPEQVKSMIGSEYVLNMHTRSGLLDEVAASNRTLAAAEDLLVEYLEQWDTGFVPLAGSNVKFDRGWLNWHMPRVTEQVHYRDICVSSMKETVRRFFPAAYQATPQKAYAHRAMGDVRESISEYWYYLEAIGSPVLKAA